MPFAAEPAGASDERSLLEAYGMRSCARQWRAFLSAMIGEFMELGDPGQLDKLLTRVGVRFARSLALPACESLGELEAAMNRTWDALDWGSVRLAEQGRMLRIVHSAYPIIDAEGDAATLMLGSVLQGVYTYWLGSQGGDPQFRARFASPGARPPSPLCFDYGRHGAAS
jgi:hypothetical protein